MIRKSRAHSIPRVAAAISLVLALGGASDQAIAQSRRAQSVPADHGSLTGPPIMAIVSIKHQRISLYDANGAAMRARTSSGATDYETPVGIYSILQKNRDHYSNLYDDAAMPFMQRITWSGIALHEGQLPGYPASHGCVRMPGTFAERIFPLTKIGMRVIVARDNVAPVDIAHPNLLNPATINSSAIVTRTAYDESETQEEGPRPFLADLRRWPERQAQMDAFQSDVADRNADVERSKGPITELKEVVGEKSKKRTAAAKILRTAEKRKRSADDKAASAESALAFAKDPARLKPWETAKAKADAAVLTTTDRLAKATAAVQAAPNERARTRAERAMRAAERAKQAAEAQIVRAERDLAAAKLPARYTKQEDAAAKAAAVVVAASQAHAEASAAVQSAEAELQSAKQDLAAAEAAVEAAVKAATDARRKTLPVSIFISRKTQRIYLRQGHEPVMDVPISISEPDKPIGTHVFTAVDYGTDSNSLRWTAVSLAPRPGREVAKPSIKSGQLNDSASEPFPTDAAAAAAVLDRLTLPPEIVERVSISMWPGSSLIVSDEPMHKETNQATDFIVLMSGEPQGGIKHRPKPPPVRRYYDDPWESEPNYYTAYDRYGRKVRIVPKKPLFSWW